MAGGLKFGVVLFAALLCFGCASTPPHPPGVIDLAADGAPVVAHWEPLDDTTTRRPAVVALHGCGGLYLRDGKRFDPRYPRYIERLHQAGYPDSYHGFDGTAPVRFRTDVSNGVDPAGVHLGANPVTGAQALAEMDAFLRRVLK